MRSATGSEAEKPRSEENSEEAMPEITSSFARRARLARLEAASSGASVPSSVLAWQAGRAVLGESPLSEGL